MDSSYYKLSESADGIVRLPAMTTVPSHSEQAAPSPLKQTMHPRRRQAESSPSKQAIPHPLMETWLPLSKQDAPSPSSQTVPPSDPLMPHPSTSVIMAPSQKTSSHYMEEASKDRWRHDERWIQACEKGYSKCSITWAIFATFCAVLNLYSTLTAEYKIDSCSVLNSNGEKSEILLSYCIAINNNQDSFNPRFSKEYNILRVGMICLSILDLIAGTFLIVISYKKSIYLSKLVKVRTIYKGILNNLQCFFSVVLILSILVSAWICFKLNRSTSGWEPTLAETELLFQIPGIKDFQPIYYTVNFSRSNSGFIVALKLIGNFTYIFEFLGTFLTNSLHMISGSFGIFGDIRASAITDASYTITDYEKMNELYQAYKKEYPERPELEILHAHVLEGLDKEYIRVLGSADNVRREFFDYLRRAPESLNPRSQN